MVDEGSWNHHHNASNRSNNNTSSSSNSSGNRFQHLGVSHMNMNPVYNQYDGRAAMSSGSGSNYVNGIHKRGAFPMHLLQNVRQVEHPLSIAEHQLTIAQDGTILSATENILGYSANSLFMASIFDTVHEQDLPGFKAVKKYFWEKGRPEVKAFLRRRGIDGEWIWLEAMVLEYIDQPVPGAIIIEREVVNIEVALEISRLTRISAMVASALEDSWALRHREAADERKIKQRKRRDRFMKSQCSSLGEKSDRGCNDEMTDSDSQYKEQRQSALQQNQPQHFGKNQKLSLSRQTTNNARNSQYKEHYQSVNEQNQPQYYGKSQKLSLSRQASNNARKTKRTEESSTNQIDDQYKAKINSSVDDLEDILELVRSGVSLDMSKTVLSHVELKMVSYFLSGRLQLNDLTPLVLQILATPENSISVALDEYLSLKNREEGGRQIRNQSESKSSLTSFNSDGSEPLNPSSESLKISGSRSVDAGLYQRNTTASPYHYMSLSREKEIPLAFSRKSSRETDSTSLGYNHHSLQINQRQIYSSSSSHQIGHSEDRQNKMHHHNRVKSLQMNGEQRMRGLDMPQLHSPIDSRLPPPLSVINLAYDNIGNSGIELLSEVLFVDTPFLKTLDLSFCGLDERGILVLCRSLRRRKKRNLPMLQGLILSGNIITYRAAKDLGTALSSGRSQNTQNCRRVSSAKFKDSAGTGYDEDNEYDIEDDNGEDDVIFGEMVKNEKLWGIGSNVNSKTTCKRNRKRKNSNGHNFEDLSKRDLNNDGLLLLHLACCSLSAESFYQLLVGLGQDCPLRELRVPSNNLGPSGSTLLMNIFQGEGLLKFRKGEPVMPNLDRLDFSDNKIGNDGVAALTKSISKRKKFVELRLSNNGIGALGIETIMNKLYQHKVRSLYLDNNVIGDKGCQLVAASLPTMHSLLKLSLSFNQIGARGVTSLMRALLRCESLMSLSLSGNVMKVSGSMSMGFCLAHHSRLEVLELDNCFLSKAAQCHIVAGIISNRWVPMKNLIGFRVAPPMVAIGALEVVAQSLGNEECFRVRRDMQMKAMVERRKIHAEKVSISNHLGNNCDLDENDLSDNESFLCLLEWLPQIPFDEDELLDLQNYFLEVDGGENSDSAALNDMNVVLKHRGDLLANLSTKAAEEIREISPIEQCDTDEDIKIGMPLDTDEESIEDSTIVQVVKNVSTEVKMEDEYIGRNEVPSLSIEKKNEFIEDGIKEQKATEEELEVSGGMSLRRNGAVSNLSSQASGERRNHMSSSEVNDDSALSRGSLKSLDSQGEVRDQNGGNGKARITKFPKYEAQLQELKQHAQSIMDNEYDPVQQDIIAQEFAETSLTVLRELKYRCMQKGLNGWRVGKIRRKVLIVDDSNVTRKMIARAFQKANFIVDTAENGREGVDKLKHSMYDIVFMDINMPVLNGFDATKELREWEDLKRPGVRQPICALTATYVDDFERSELMKFKTAGLDVMESKPCNIPRLFKVVDDVSPMFTDLNMNLNFL